MEFKAKETLFIAVDVQKRFCTGADFTESRKRVKALHSSLLQHELPNWQIYMEVSNNYSGIADGEPFKRERLRRVQQNTMLLPQTQAQLIFSKTATAPRNEFYKSEMQKANPQAVFLYGYHLEACVRDTALQVKRFLPAAQVFIMSDCTQASDMTYDNGLFYKAMAQEGIQAVDSTHMEFEHKAVKLMGPVVPAASARAKAGYTPC